MNALTDARNRLQPVQEGAAEGTLREQMEATARAHLAADSAHVDEAMASVRWERRGLLQTLTRGAR